MAGIVHKVEKALGGGNNPNTNNTNKPSYSPTSNEKYGNNNQPGAAGGLAGKIKQNITGGGGAADNTGDRHQGGGYVNNTDDRDERGYGPNAGRGNKLNIDSDTPGYSPTSNDNYSTTNQGGGGGLAGKIKEHIPGGGKTGENVHYTGDPDESRNTHNIGDREDRGHAHNIRGRKQDGVGLQEGIEEKFPGGGSGYNEDDQTGAPKGSGYGRGFDHTGAVDHIDTRNGHTGAVGHNDGGFSQSGADGRHGNIDGGGLQEPSEGGGKMDKIKAKIPFGGGGDHKSTTRDAATKY